MFRRNFPIFVFSRLEQRLVPLLALAADYRGKRALQLRRVGQEGRRAGGRGYSVANWKDDAIYEYAYTIRNFRRVSFVIRHIYTYRGYIVRPNYRFRLPFPFEMRDKVYIWQVFRQHFYYSRRVMPPAR